MLTKKQLDYNPWDVLENSTKSTSDWLDLKSSTNDEFIIFVTGETRLNKRMNHLLTGANYYGKGMSWNDEFIMKQMEIPEHRTSEAHVFHFPKTKPDIWDTACTYFDKRDLKCVEGDIYGVPLRLLSILDKKEGNGDWTNRKEIWVDFLEQPGSKNTKAWTWTVDIDVFLDYVQFLSHIKTGNIIKYNSGKEAYYF